MTTSKVLSLSAFTELLPASGTLALGGLLLENRPSSLVRAVIRAGMRIELLTSSPVGSWDVDVLVAAGLVERVRVPHVSLGEAGLAPAISAAGAAGRIEFDDVDEAVLIGSFLAAAEGAETQLLTRLGPNDVLKDNPLLTARGADWEVEACHPDIVLLHAPVADAAGNLGYLGSRFADLLLAQAGRRVYAQVDAIVPSAVIRDIGVAIPGHLVHGVIHTPFGAHPAGSGGCYSADFEHLAGYAEAVRGGLADLYLIEFCGPVEPAAYRELVGAATERRLEQQAGR